MLIVFRWWYFLGVTGLVLLGVGIAEIRIATRTATEPEAIRVQELEGGKLPTQPYVRLDAHYAVFESTVYEHKRERIKDLIYPVVSEQHPWSLAWQRLQEKYSSPDQIPTGEIPALEPIRVLMLSDRFDKVDDIPDSGRDEPAAEGILFTWDELDSGERDLVEMLVSGPAAEQVVVLDLDRKPRSLAFSIGMLISGVVASFFAVGMFFKPKNKGSNGPASDDQLVQQ